MFRASPWVVIPGIGGFLAVSREMQVGSMEFMDLHPVSDG